MTTTAFSRKVILIFSCIISTAISTNGQSDWPVPYNPDSDLDGIVGVQDLVAFLQVYGTYWDVYYDDIDPTNEIQKLTIEGDSLFLDLIVSSAIPSIYNLDPTSLSDAEIDSLLSPFRSSISLDDLTGPEGPMGQAGESAYEVWLAAGNTGSTDDFFESLTGPEGPAGEPGSTGQSAFDIWISENNSGDTSDFLLSLTGPSGSEGLSAYEIWLTQGNVGSEQDFFLSLQGPQGVAGPTGPQGTQGESAYDIWLQAGNFGSEEDFLESLSPSNQQELLDSLISLVEELQQSIESTASPTNPTFSGIQTPHATLTFTEDSLFVVPAGVFQIEVTISGGKGGNGGSTVPPSNNNQSGCGFGYINGGSGGYGGYFRGMMNVSQGDSIIFYVGENGINGSTPSTFNANGSSGSNGTASSMYFGTELIIQTTGGTGGGGACCYQCGPSNATNNQPGTPGTHGGTTYGPNFENAGVFTTSTTPTSGAFVKIKY